MLCKAMYRYINQPNQNIQETISNCNKCSYNKYNGKSLLIILNRLINIILKFQKPIKIIINIV